MARLRFSLPAVFLTLTAGSALGQGGPGVAPVLARTCTTHGSANVKAIDRLPANDPVFNKALAAATLPAAKALALKGSHCIQGGVPGQEIRGENTDPMPRVRLQGQTGAVDYLAPLPAHRDGKPTTYYALVRVWGSGAVRVDTLYDGIPDEGVLNETRHPVDGGYDSLGYDEKTGKLIDAENYLPTQIKAGAEAFKAAKTKLKSGKG